MRTSIYIISLLCAIFTFTDVKAYDITFEHRMQNPDVDLIISATETIEHGVDTRYNYENDFSGGPGGNRPDAFYRLTLTTKTELTIWPEDRSKSNAVIFLLDKQGWPLDSNWDQWDSRKIKKILEPGTYYLVLEGRQVDGWIRFSVQSNVPKTTPINVGTKSSDFTYTNTQNSDFYNSFANGYGGSIGNDIPYTFTITKPMDITITHNGSKINNTNIFFTHNMSVIQLLQGTSQHTIKDLPAGTYTFISESAETVWWENLYDKVNNGSITTTITGTVSKTILIGNVTYPFSYQDTRNSNDWNNDFTDYAGKEIRYKFSGYNPGMYLQISHCGSVISDTRIQLLDGNQKVLASSIDYTNPNSPCKGSKYAFLRAYTLSGNVTIVSEGRYANGNITTKILASPYPFETDWGTLRGVKTKTDTYNIGKCHNLYETGSGNDIIHKFTLEDPLDVSISHAGSAVNKSKIYLLNASMGVIATSESGAGDPKGSNLNHAFLKRELLPAGTYYIVSEAASQDANLIVSLNTTPKEKSVIDIGSKSSGFVYSDTKRFQDYTNTYTANANVDIEYKLAITQVMDLAMSFTGGTLYFLDSQKELINQSSGSSTLNLNTLQVGTYYIVNTGPASNEGNATVKITGTLTTVSNYIEPSTERTYTLKRVYTDRNTYLTEIQYYDGLGRPNQLVQSKITPSGADLVTIQEYDEFGRPSNSWQPTPIYKNNSRYMEDIQVRGQARNIYQDAKPFSMPEYESSPLKKTIKQYGPGQDWHNNGKAVSTNYKINISDNAAFNCYIYKAGGTNQSPALTKSGNYPTGQLFVSEVRDEDDNVSYEFKNNIGQVILTRQISDNANHDTYHVYNDCGYLCYVLPPRINDEGITQAKLDELAYQYKYDDLGRCIAKKLPGCDWVYYIYDKDNRLIFAQDGEQRLKGIWAFSIPDIFGRTVLTGTCTNNLNYMAVTPIDVKVTATWAKATNSYKGYTLTAGFTLTSPTILSVNYYDNYEFMGINSLPATTDANFKYTADANYGTWYAGDYTDANKYKNKGLLTGTLTAQLNSNGTVSTTYLCSVMYYDYKGQLIQANSNNHLTGGFEKEYIIYNDYTGQPLKRKHVHQATGKTTLTEDYAYSYDHAGRLLKTTHKLNGGTEMILAENKYDELGRLKEKKSNSRNELTGTYTYNVRSWLSRIRHYHFHEDLNYTHSGNIKNMQWVLYGQTRKYDYTYDNLSRLKAAIFTGITGEQYSTAYTYDKHGNILTLQRYGKKDAGTNASSFGLVDNLTMAYNGNQLIKAEDAAANVIFGESADFKNHNNAAVEYTYNKNGAMTKDLNKGVSQIQYNSLNLPTLTDIKNPEGEGRNYYTYSASGVKLKVKHTYNPNFLPAPVTGSDVNVSSLTQVTETDYVGNKIYENGALKRVLIDGGYIEGGTYYFYVNDHLGNNRAVARADGPMFQRNHYYPFGMTFADSYNSNIQPYKYNGKELDRKHGLNLYDYSARYYDQAIGRFTTVDPLAEKYYSWSPYAYVMNNPLKYIDPDGKAIIVSGALSKRALQELQSAAGSSITLTIADDGNICYTKNIEEKLLFNAAKIVEIIDNNSIFIDLKTINGGLTSTNNLFVGGAFMGNEVYSDRNGNKTVVASQEINPNVLGAADKHIGTPGSLTMHELTEAYIGAQNSQKSGSSAPPATGSNANNSKSPYTQAHDKASFQNPIFERMYDSEGNITTDVNSAVRVEWFVKSITNKDKVIQIFEP